MKVENLKFSQSDVKFTFDGQERSIKDLVKIDVNNLDEELQNQGGLFVYWALLCAHASHEMRLAERNLLQLQDEQIVEIKNHYYSLGEPIPEYHIRAIARTKLEYLQQEKVFLARKKDFEVLLAIRNAFWQRKNMLESLVSDSKKEYYSEPITNNNQLRR